MKLQILVNLEAKIFRSESRSEHRSSKKSTFKLNGLLNNHYVKNYRADCPDITNYLLILTYLHSILSNYLVPIVELGEVFLLDDFLQVQGKRF